MAAVASEVRRRHPGVERIALLHRVGRLAVSDVAVVVAVSAPHRDEAFDAARHAIDTLKETVPLWKREEWPGGSQWVEGCAVGERA
jgi:molybdopterin synthase catalytic subunit